MTLTLACTAVHDIHTDICSVTQHLPVSGRFSARLSRSLSVSSMPRLPRTVSRLLTLTIPPGERNKIILKKRANGSKIRIYSGLRF